MSIEFLILLQLQVLLLIDIFHGKDRHLERPNSSLRILFVRFSVSGSNLYFRLLRSINLSNTLFEPFSSKPKPSSSKVYLQILVLSRVAAEGVSPIVVSDVMGLWVFF
jgi:hypothetical protein